MADYQNGRSAALITLITGRAVLGLATEDDLAVDSRSDLEVDDSNALEISPGVLWVGTSATKTIET